MKLTKDELKQKIDESIEDNDLKIGLLEDIEDSIENEENSTEMVEKSTFDELQSKYEDLQNKYKERFFETKPVETKKESFINDGLQEKQYIDITEI